MVCQWVGTCLEASEARKRMEMLVTASYLGLAPEVPEDLSRSQMAVVKDGRCGWNSSSYLSA